MQSKESPRKTPGCSTKLRGPRMRIIGVIPAAGRARRLQPLACSKEVLIVRGRLVMDYLLERMRAAECSEIHVVTRPEKSDVIEHARSRGAEVILAEPSSVSESLLAGIVDAPADATILFGFPDTLWGPHDGFARLVDRLGSDCEVALGIFRAEEPERSDVVELDGDSVSAITVKPSHPSSELVWGCAAAPARILAGLAGWDEPGEYFDVLARKGRVAGVRLDDPFVDVGTPEALRRAELGVVG